jgi:hypothetical protein
MLDTIAAARPAHGSRRSSTPEIEARIAQYELAWRLQSSVPDVVDLSASATRPSRCTARTARKPGHVSRTTACSRAGSPERGVRFVQIYHQGWDQHDNLPKASERSARDRPGVAALVTDLAHRGMLEDTS